MNVSGPFRLTVLIGVAFALIPSISHSAEVRVASDSFVREEVEKIVREVDQQKLVGKNRSGALTLANPSTDLLGRVAALGEPAFPLLAAAYGRANEGTKYGITRLLVEQGEAGCQALARLLADRNVSGRRWILQATAGTYTAAIVAALREVVNDPDRELAERAVGELGESEDDQGIAQLKQLVHGKDRRLALAAAKALAFGKDATGVALLIEALAATRTPSTGDRWTGSELMGRLKIVQALGSSGAPAAVEPLIALFVEATRAVEDEDELPTAQTLGRLAVQGRAVEPAVKAMLEASYAATALSSLSYRRARPTIEPLVSHGNHHVRRMALEILASCGDTGTVPVLARVLGVEGEKAQGRLTDMFAAMAVGSESDRESILAAQGLRQIGGPAATRVLQTAWRRAPRALAPWFVICLAALDEPKALEIAISLARGSDSELKVAAISALGLARSKQAIDALAGLVDSGDLQVRLLAASSLSRPGNVAACGPLTRLLQKSRAAADRQSESVAVLGLGMAGDDRVVPTLEKLVKSDDASIRKAAVVGLYYLTGKCTRYTNLWRADSRFEPTTFHQRLRAERLARLQERR